MRSMTFALLMTVYGSVAAVSTANAVDKKPAKAAAKGEVTLKGTMSCAKCFLKETDKCQNVLTVKEGDKDSKYYLAQNEVAKKNHGQVCGGTASATVKGAVGDADGKKILTPSEIKYE